MKVAFRIKEFASMHVSDIYMIVNHTIWRNVYQKEEFNLVEKLGNGYFCFSLLLKHTFLLRKLSYI